MALETVPSPYFDLRGELKHYLHIAWPLVLNNLALAGMQFADTIMVGQLGADALASVAVGSAIWFFGFCVSMGLLMALSATIAVKFGEQKYAQIGLYMRQGYYLAGACSLVMLLVANMAIAPLFEWIGIAASFRDSALAYVQAIMWGAPGMMLFLVFRFATEGLGRTRPIMVSAIAALFVNVALNYLLIYGHGGFPAMGAEGAGYASAITSSLLALGMFCYLRLSSYYSPFLFWSGSYRAQWSLLKELIWIGVPIAVALGAEVGLFNAVALLMGTLGATVAASHQIAINFASTTFMIPMAISAAATVRVGHLLGANARVMACYAGRIGIALCGGVMLFSALMLLFFRDVLVTWYTPVQDVAALAIDMLAIAALFQVVDGFQVGAAGVLRAYKDTRVPMFITLFAYWVCAFPTAYFFAIQLSLPATSIWWAFVMGLGLAAILLNWRAHRTFQRSLGKL